MDTTMAGAEHRRPGRDVWSSVDGRHWRYLGPCDAESGGLPFIPAGSAVRCLARVDGDPRPAAPPASPRRRGGTGPARHALATALRRPRSVPASQAQVVASVATDTQAGRAYSLRSVAGVLASVARRPVSAFIAGRGS